MNCPPPELVEALTQLGYRLMRLLFQEAKEAFAQLGFTPLQAEVLRRLSEGNPSPTQLAEEMEMSPSQTSSLLSHRGPGAFGARPRPRGPKEGPPPPHGGGKKAGGSPKVHLARDLRPPPEPAWFQGASGL